MRLKYEPALQPLHISVKQFFSTVYSLATTQHNCLQSSGTLQVLEFGIKGLGSGAQGSGFGV